MQVEGLVEEMKQRQLRLEPAHYSLLMTAYGKHNLWDKVEWVVVDFQIALQFLILRLDTRPAGTDEPRRLVRRDGSRLLDGP
jgi:hypothetical protein